MPGFVACGSGSGPSATIETRRKNRWMFQSINGFGTADLLVLMAASRPKIKFDEPEMHHNQEVARFAGKTDWEPITLKWYDAEQPDVSADIYNWINTVSQISTANVNPPSVYKQNASLAMLDGTGQVTEQWNLCNAWPSSVDWGELDYTSSDIATIECTMRFDRAMRTCAAVPAPQTFGPPC